MADGTVQPIQDVQIADLVLATDPMTGETAAEDVTDLIVGNGIKNLVKVGTDSDGDSVTGWITATSGYPFWVEGGGWTNAGHLQLGDLLIDDEGTAVAVIDLKTSITIQTVYNLTVNELHTYYVLAGDEQILVHNAGCKGPADSPIGRAYRHTRIRSRLMAYRVRKGSTIRGITATTISKSLTHVKVMACGPTPSQRTPSLPPQSRS